MAKGNPRRSNGSRRNALRKRVMAMGLPCALCGRPIDYSLPAGHPMSYELDEIVPVSKGGSPYDIENVQPAHRICNQRKSNKTSVIKTKNKPLPHSREWRADRTRGASPPPTAKPSRGPRAIFSPRGR